MSRLIIVVGIFFIIPISPMDIIKKKKSLPLILSPQHSSLKKIVLVKTLEDQDELNLNREKEIYLNKDITKNILQYIIALDNKDFECIFNQIDLWKDFRIPLGYHYFLTSNHLNILGTYFAYVPDCRTSNGIYEMHYYLSTSQEYKKFLTLPYQLREHLTKLPNSHLEKATALNAEQNLIINKKKILWLEKSDKERQEKPILPDKKNKIS